MSSDGKDPKICIIEGTIEDRTIFRRYLLQDTAYTYHFYEEETGERGLELCQRVQPDCILLDFHLPDMDGVEFLQRLADGNGSVPFAVIVLTGLGDDEIAHQAMQNGAQDYLVKDEMTAGNLFRAIHSAIERTVLRRILEQQGRDLERKNQEMQAFAYALAHDLRSPLRAINGFAQIVQQEYQDVLGEQGLHYVENIVHAGKQMDHLIDDLLNYIRLGHRAVRKNPVMLHEVISQVIEGLAERVQGLLVQVSLADDLPMVYGDQTLIQQIMQNLLENALTYRREDIQLMISIDWSKDGKNAVLSIADNGIGIAQKHHEKIFTIFQRLHSEEDFPGTGIGLAVVKKATDLLGGSVWVDSRVGEGSTFYLRLPLYEDE